MATKMEVRLLEVLAAFLGVLEVVGSKPVIFFFHLVTQSLTFLPFAKGGGEKKRL